MKSVRMMFTIHPTIHHSHNKCNILLEARLWSHSNYGIWFRDMNKKTVHQGSVATQYVTDDWDLRYVSLRSLGPFSYRFKFEYIEKKITMHFKWKVLNRIENSPKLLLYHVTFFEETVLAILQFETTILRQRQMSNSGTLRIVWNFRSTHFGSKRAISVGNSGSGLQAHQISLVTFGPKRLDPEFH